MGTESLSGSRTVGKFSITVDPSAAEPWTIRPVDEPPGSGKPSLRLQTTGPLPSGNTVLLGPQNVTVTGPGTYNPSTHTMSANVVITHNAPTAGDFDELQMVVTSLTSSSPGIAFVTNNNSTTGVGAVMAFADIQSTTSTSSICGVGVRKTSATHALRILDPADKAFSFAIDVRALSGSGASISPDCDGDGYNAELGEDAGNDCNNNNASASPAGGACVCSGAGIVCSTSGSSCTQTLASGSSYTCNGACECNFQGASPTRDLTVTCQQDCNFGCNGVVDGPDGNRDACTATCTAASNCDFSCTNTASASCSYTCSAGSTCNLACNGNTGTSVCAAQCQTGANCTVDCPGGEAQCGVTTCNSSDCNVDCGTSTSSTFTGDCGVSTQCLGGSTCTVGCVGSSTGLCGVATCRGSDCNITCGTATAVANFGDYCGVGDCRNGANCKVTCTNTPDCYLMCRGAGGSGAASCIMDCSAVPVAERNGPKCNLDCRNGLVKTSLGGGVYRCL